MSRTAGEPTVDPRSGALVFGNIRRKYLTHRAGVPRIGRLPSPDGANADHDEAARELPESCQSIARALRLKTSTNRLRHVAVRIPAQGGGLARFLARKRSPLFVAGGWEQQTAPPSMFRHMAKTDGTQLTSPASLARRGALEKPGKKVGECRRAPWAPHGWRWRCWAFQRTIFAASLCYG